MSASTCPKFEDHRGVLVAIALDETRFDDPAEVDEVRRHVQECPHCRGELEAYRHVILLLRPPPIPDATAGEIAANVERRVRAWVAGYERRRRRLTWAGGIAAAAAVVLGVLCAWPRRRRPEPAGSGATARVPSLAAGTQETDTKDAPGFPPAPDNGRGAGAPTVVRAPRDAVTHEEHQKLEQAGRLREEGRRLLRRKAFAEAEVPLRRALALLDDLVREAPHGEAARRAHYEKYRCHQLLGDYLARESSLRRYVGTVRERDGDEAAARALVEDAHRLIRERDMDAAGRRLETALGLCPTGGIAVAAHVLLGVAAEEQHLSDLAYSQYHRALALGPPVRLAYRIYRNMIAINAWRGRYDAAIADAEALCALPEQEVPLEERIVHRCLLARLHTRKGNRGKAAHILRALIVEHGAEHTRYARLQLRDSVDDLIDAEILQ